MDIGEERRVSWGNRGRMRLDSTRRRICLECAGDDIADG